MCFCIPSNPAYTCHHSPLFTFACFSSFNSYPLSAVSPHAQPSTMDTLAQNLFRTSALLNAFSIIGHARFGFHNTYPALATIPSTKEHTLGMTSAWISYDFAHATLATAGRYCFFLTWRRKHCSSLPALLNWQWSRTLGPKTMEEQIVMWTIAVAGGVSSWRFMQVGLYGPLICTFVAPVCSLVGWWLS